MHSRLKVFVTYATSELLPTGQGGAILIGGSKFIGVYTKTVRVCQMSLHSTAMLQTRTIFVMF